MDWRFLSALRGKKSPTQCPGLAGDQKGVCSGTHSTYNVRFGHSSGLPLGGRCVLHPGDWHTPVRNKWGLPSGDRCTPIKGQVWATIGRGDPLKRQHSMLEERFPTHITERWEVAKHVWKLKAGMTG